MALAKRRLCGQGHDDMACPGPKGKGHDMIWTAGILGGAAYGAITALRRGGRRLDALQYGAGYAIAFGLLGLAISVFLDRMG